MTSRYWTLLLLAVSMCGCTQELWTGKRKDDPQAKELSFKAAVGEVNIQIAPLQNLSVESGFVGWGRKRQLEDGSGG